MKNDTNLYYNSNNSQQQQYQNSLSNSFNLRYPSFDSNGFDHAHIQQQQQQQQYSSSSRNDDDSFNGFQSVSDL